MASALLCLSVIASGCQFVEARQRAEHLVGSPSKVHDAGTATGYLSVMSAPRLDRRGLARGAGDSEQLAGLRASLERGATRRVPVELDLRNHQARVGAPGEELMLFDGTAMFVRRGDPEATRPWAVLEFADLDRSRLADELVPVGVVPLNPALLVDFVAGALSGSVELVREEVLYGVDVRRYELQIDWFKAIDNRFRRDAGLPRLRDDRIAAMQALLETLRLTQPVSSAHVWIDDDGAVRKLSWTLQQSMIVGVPTDDQPPVRRAIDTTVSLEIEHLGAPVDIQIPGDDQVVRTQGFGELMRESAPPAQAQVPDGLQGSIPDGLGDLMGDGGAPQLPEGVQLPEGIELPMDAPQEGGQ